MQRRLLASLFVAALPCGLAPGLAAPAAAQDFDLVIVRGRVVDPESGLDAVRSIGVRGGKVAAISEAPLSGKTVIDAGGLVVAPGFIDLHAHGQTEETYRLQALDGVTTSFELEVGTGDVDRWYRRAGEGTAHQLRREHRPDPGADGGPPRSRRPFSRPATAHTKLRLPPRSRR